MWTNITGQAMSHPSSYNIYMLISYKLPVIGVFLNKLSHRPWNQTFKHERNLVIEGFLNKGFFTRSGSPTFPLIFFWYSGIKAAIFQISRRQPWCAVHIHPGRQRHCPLSNQVLPLAGHQCPRWIFLWRTPGIIVSLLLAEVMVWLTKIKDERSYCKCLKI